MSEPNREDMIWYWLKYQVCRSTTYMKRDSHKVSAPRPFEPMVGPFLTEFRGWYGHTISLYAERASASLNVSISTSFSNKRLFHFARQASRLPDSARSCEALLMKHDDLSELINSSLTPRSCSRSFTSHACSKALTDTIIIESLLRRCSVFWYHKRAVKIDVRGVLVMKVGDDIRRIPNLRPV